MVYSYSKHKNVKNVQSLALVLLLFFISATSLLAIPKVLQGKNSMQTQSTNSQQSSVNLLSQVPSKEILNQLIPKTFSPSEQKNIAKIQQSLPFSGFLRNSGQEGNVVNYYYSTGKSAIGFGISTIYFEQTVPALHNKTVSFTLKFDGSANVIPMGENKLSFSTNYFLRNRSYTAIPSYKEVWYYNLYQNIDLRYYMSQHGLKYEFIVHPGGNPQNIQISVSSNVLAHVSNSEVSISPTTRPDLQMFTDSNLTVYQQIAKGKTIINSHFQQNGNTKLSNTYSFHIGTYDSKLTLIIDPYFIGLSTYIGGSSDDYVYAIAVDSSGNIYIAGTTSSPNFPTKDAYNRS